MYEISDSWNSRPPGALLALALPQMVRLVPLLPHAVGAPGRRVRLSLVAPHFDNLIVQTLTGRVAGAVPGYFGVLRYLMELDAPLPPGFDPLGELPWFARDRRVRYVLLTPAPEAQTLETPPDVIGETLEQGGLVHVFVSVGPAKRALRADPVRATAESRCPFLCMGDLEAVADPHPTASPRR